MTEKNRRRWLRYVLVGVALLVVIAALAGVKVQQIKQLIGMGEAMQAAGPPPETVGSAVAHSWNSSVWVRLARSTQPLSLGDLGGRT